MSTSSIVMFELNEVPWRVVLDHVARRPHGALARLLAQCEAFTTVAQEQRLSPWVTWSSLHRGVPEGEHGITNLNADVREVDRARPPVWSLLRDAGVSTGVFGSMHSSALPQALRGVAFHVPDPFAEHPQTLPPAVEPFQRFNLDLSRRSARNVERGVPWREGLALARSLPSLGLRPRTLASTAAQLLHERVDAAKVVRRRSVQARLGFDVFTRLLARTQPRYACFFTNHVAATMHRFWAAAYPDDYARNDYPAAWRAAYRNEIAWAMDQTDAMLAPLLEYTHAARGRELWLSTSMGQAATRADNRTSTQLYLEDPAALMSALGYAPAQYTRQAAMLPRVVLALDDDAASSFAARTQGLRVAGEPVEIEWLGGNRVCVVVPVVQGRHEGTATIRGRSVAMAELGFADVAIEDESGQTAYHVPEGVLAIHSAAAPTRARVDGGLPRPHCSTLAIAPRVLERLGAPVPEYMRERPLRTPAHAGPRQAL
ncbi:MAG: hypothetical protein K1X88_25135, partial [Nannocystaceae bacterium]|nr:hypothetical protein [Nannocystaceae bacterium]